MHFFSLKVRELIIQWRRILFQIKQIRYLFLYTRSGNWTQIRCGDAVWLDQAFRRPWYIIACWTLIRRPIDGWLNGPVTSSDCTEPKVTSIMNFKICGRKRSWPTFVRYFESHLEESKANHEQPQDVCWPCWGSNQAPNECKSKTLPFQPSFSVFTCYFLRAVKPVFIFRLQHSVSVDAL
jgi:hypothetical protein